MTPAGVSIFSHAQLALSLQSLISLDTMSTARIAKPAEVSRDSQSSSGIQSSGGVEPAAEVALSAADLETACLGVVNSVHQGNQTCHGAEFAVSRLLARRLVASETD